MSRLRTTLVVLALLSVACGKEEIVHVRGQLTGTGYLHWVVTPCNSQEAYWVRVLASNPHVKFSRRIGELRQQGQESEILAELRGRVKRPSESDVRSVGQEITGRLIVSEISSVELGTCD